MSKDYRDIKDMAKDVRKELKAQFPKCKFSVTIERFTGGQALAVRLMEASENALANGSQYEQINHYTVRQYTYDEYVFNLRGQAPKMTTYGYLIMKAADRIGNMANWDESDPMVDYFHCNYYFSLAIGKWDKPFKVVAK